MREELPVNDGERQEEQQKQVWDALWSKPISYQWDGLSQVIFQSIAETAGELKGKRIAEAGSGTGKISLRLAMEGASAVLIDYSQAALEQSRLAFRQKNKEAEWLLADIRNIPLADASCDLTWNAGVLEHFPEDEMVRILREMSRVTKPGGTILSLVPYARSLPYRLGKAYAEAGNFWMYGKEDPVDSLIPLFEQAGLVPERETDIGFVQSLEFLDFIPGAGTLKEWAANWYKGLSETERAWFPGYLLVTVGKRPLQ